MWSRSALAEAYLALQHAEAALEYIHNGEVDALPVIDHLVVVNAGNQEDWAIVFTSLFYPLLGGLIGVPPSFFCSILFRLNDKSQELNMP